MKKMYLFRVAAFVMILSFSLSSFSQTTSWVKQVITVNSGKFEVSPPYLDYVTLSSFNPSNKTINDFGTIFTQSAQDILIQGKFAYIEAQDSLIKYDLNTYKRVAAIADSGLNKLGMYKNRLLVSKQYPVNTYFVEVLDTANLSLVSKIGNITGDCGGIASTGDSVYVAVNEGWMGTEGKIAVIDPTTWTLIREINLGASAIGINNLYMDGGKLYAVNTTPYGASTGSISIYNPATGVIVNSILNVTIGSGVGVKNNTLYVGMNNGIGSFDLTSMKITDTVIVKDPGSALFKYILSSTLDTLNNLFYVNIGDYVTDGYCLVASLNGDSVTSFATGISTQTIGIDYRTYPSGITEKKSLSSLILYPNPVGARLTLAYSGEQEVNGILITDEFGRLLNSFKTNLKKHETLSIPVENLPSGLYCVILKTDGESVISKFIKK
jgi:hypothetical protein